MKKSDIKDKIIRISRNDYREGIMTVKHLNIWVEVYDGYFLRFGRSTISQSDWDIVNHVLDNIKQFFDNNPNIESFRHVTDLYGRNELAKKSDIGPLETYISKADIIAILYGKGEEDGSKERNE